MSLHDMLTEGNTRRRFLVATAGTTVGLAGCTGGGGGGTGGDGSGGGSGGGSTGGSTGGGSGGGAGGDTGGGTGGSSGGGTPTPSMGTEWIPSGVMQKANEEGEVVIYGAIDEPDLKDPIKPRFEEMFPDITARVSGLGSSEIASKLVSERRANNVRSDVSIFSYTTARSVASADVYVRPGNDHWLKQQASELDYPPTYWRTPEAKAYEIPGYGLPYTLIYNTDKTSEADAPDAWEDLGDDQWTGSNGIVMQHPSGLSSMGGLFATLYQTWGEEKWRQVAQNIADNNPQLLASNSQSYRVLVQGEKALSPNYINDLVSQLAAGEDPPAATKWLDPSLQENVPQHITKNSPNPNAAMVFASWFMSEEGQNTIGDTGRTPVHPQTAATHDLFKTVIPEGVTIRPTAFNNPTYQGTSYQSEPEAFAPLFNEIFGSPSG